MSFDEALERLETLKDLLQKSKTVDEEKNAKLNELSQKVDELKDIVTQKDAELRKSEEEKNQLNTEVEMQKQEVKNKDEEFNTLRAEVDNVRRDKGKVEVEDAKMRVEYLAVQEQFKKISAMYQDLSTKRDEAIDVRELLSIYIVLLEEVFQGKPHARILFMLHGDKTQLTRGEIAKAGGFQPAIVLKSIHELAAADLLKYDMDNDIVELVRKIY